MIVKYTIIVCFTQLIFCCFGHRACRNDNEIITIESLENKIDWMNPSSSLLQRERRIVFFSRQMLFLAIGRVEMTTGARNDNEKIICIKPERRSIKHHPPDLVYHARFRKKCLKYFFDR